MRGGSLNSGMLPLPLSPREGWGLPAASASLPEPLWLPDLFWSWSRHAAASGDPSYALMCLNHQQMTLLAASRPPVIMQTRRQAFVFSLYNCTDKSLHSLYRFRRSCPSFQKAKKKVKPPFAHFWELSASSSPQTQTGKEELSLGPCKARNCPLGTGLHALSGQLSKSP